MNAKSTSIATRLLLELQEAIDENNAPKFRKIIADNAVQLNNSTVGDSFLQQQYITVLRRGLETFIKEG